MIKDAALGCTRLEIEYKPDARGELMIADQLPFSVTRAFWMARVPTEATRGGHALRRGQQCLVAMRGGCRVLVDDGKGHSARFWLYHAGPALIIPPLLWRVMDEFSVNAILLVLAEMPYYAPDYLRDRAEYESQMGMQPLCAPL